ADRGGHLLAAAVPADDRNLPGADDLEVHVLVEEVEQGREIAALDGAVLVLQQADVAGLGLLVGGALVPLPEAPVARRAEVRRGVRVHDLSVRRKWGKEFSPTKPPAARRVKQFWRPVVVPVRARVLGLRAPLPGRSSAPEGAS